jgi:hypothetical protein
LTSSGSALAAPSGIGDLEYAITMCKHFESILKTRFGASGKGLQELVLSIDDQLPPSVARTLRLIGTVRNKFAHELVPPKNIERFRTACGDAERDLEVLLALMASGRGDRSDHRSSQ